MILGEGNTLVPGRHDGPVDSRRAPESGVSGKPYRDMG